MKFKIFIYVALSLSLLLNIYLLWDKELLKEGKNNSILDEFEDTAIITGTRFSGDLHYFRILSDSINFYHSGDLFPFFLNQVAFDSEHSTDYHFTTARRKLIFDGVYNAIALNEIISSTNKNYDIRPYVGTDISGSKRKLLEMTIRELAKERLNELSSSSFWYSND